ncbi:MAG: acetate/propionate family kinase [Waddliaceae bacterium]
MNILTVNSGSSSLKFALFSCFAEMERIVSGSFTQIRSNCPTFKASYDRGIDVYEDVKGISGHAAAVRYLIYWLNDQGLSFDSVSHRIVQGGLNYQNPTHISESFVTEIRKYEALAPDHLPQEIDIIETFQQENPKTVQIACFDTTFHTKRPSHRKKYALPQRYESEGIIRYGFHGLSYESIMCELERIDPNIAKGKIIACHLGSGASLAAIKNGVCIDTTMGFTPVSGLVMSTRTGELDPGAVLYLMQEKGMSPAEVRCLIYKKSGLLALSELTSDMEELLKFESENEKVKEAIAIFCESAAKHIGASLPLLGGLQTLIFSGGIGENAPKIRSEICNSLQFLGLKLDEKKNQQRDFLISSGDSSINVFVIPSDEEKMLAAQAMKVFREMFDA